MPAVYREGMESGLMKDHGQQARASENFAGPVDFERSRPDLPFHKPWFHQLIPTSFGLSVIAL